MQLGWRIGEAELHKRLDAAAALAPTYPEIGATADAVLPAGYHHLDRRERIGTGAQQFAAASDAVMTYAMHRVSGLRVCSTDERAAVGGTVLLGVPLGPLAATFACRVTAATDEARRVGFAYGTLPGHPESGEESFLVELGEDGYVDLVIRAFSKPSSAAVRAAGPIARSAQRWFTDRYVRALRQLTAP